MSEKKLPEEYRGFPTKYLLEVFDELRAGTLPDKMPDGVMEAMDRLLRDYKLAPVFQVENPLPRP